MENWKQKALELRGSMPDGEVAKTVGVHKSTVSRFFSSLDANVKPTPLAPIATPAPADTSGTGLATQEPERALPMSRLNRQKSMTPPAQPVTVLFKNDATLVALTVLLMLAVAITVTAPLVKDTLQSNWFWAIVLGIIIDILPLLFVLRGRHVYGRFFAIATGLQFAFAFHVFDSTTWLACAKGSVISLVVTLAIYGLADLIENK